MDTERFDSLTAALADMRGRRAALRYLAAAAVAAAGAGALATGADARRRGCRRGGCTTQPPTTQPPTTQPPDILPTICQAGATVGVVTVQGNGDAAMTPVLQAGSRYLLRASGTVRSTAISGTDAEFSFILADPRRTADVLGTVDIGLSIDGNQPNWGGYDPDHVYAVELNGQGKALALRLQDLNLADNSGSLQVDVICAGAARAGLGRRIVPARNGKAAGGKRAKAKRTGRGKRGA